MKNVTGFFFFLHLFFVQISAKSPLSTQHELFKKVVKKNLDLPNKMFFHNLSVLLCEKVPHNQLSLVFYWFVCKLKYNEAISL